MRSVGVSTDDQRDNGYSIDSQLRMIKEYCEKNEYDIVDVYNDAGHSGKDLMRHEMQRLLFILKFSFSNICRLHFIYNFFNQFKRNWAFSQNFNFFRCTIYNRTSH